LCKMRRNNKVLLSLPKTDLFQEKVLKITLNNQKICK
jgi:hypothetical protein